MHQESVISYIESWDEQIKSDLEEFGDHIYKLGAARDRLINLGVEMSWLEKNLPWLPLVRKDRFEEFQECSRKNQELSGTVKEKRERICARLSDFIEMLEDNISSEDDQKIKTALAAVVVAFEDYLKKFQNYSWFLFGGLDSRIGPDQYYPDACKIYDKALEESD